jgi:glycosyltransferase involved in cell wall biosynthesis
MEGGMPYLLLVGAGDAQREKSLRSLAAGLEVADHVRFCGMQAYVRPFYWMADAFTLSSDRVETFSLAALEAMSTGLPCILTDVGGACEMIIEGVNGLLVPPRNPPLLARGWNRVIESRDSFKSDKIRRLVCDHFALDQCVAGYTGLLSGNEDDTRTPVSGLRFQGS